MKNLIKDKRGIVWVWIIFIIAVPTLVMAYMPLAAVAFQFIDICLNIYAFTDTQRQAIDILGFSLIWSPIILLFGFVAWALKSSVNPQEVSHPIVE